MPCMLKAYQKRKFMVYGMQRKSGQRFHERDGLRVRLSFQILPTAQRRIQKMFLILNHIYYDRKKRIQR